MADENNKWSRADAPPPPLFFNNKERDLVKQVNDELIERVIGQQIMYYPISLEHTNFHPLYEEAIEKTFLPPIRLQQSLFTSTTEDLLRIKIFLFRKVTLLLTTKNYMRLLDHTSQDTCLVKMDFMSKSQQTVLKQEVE